MRKILLVSLALLTSCVYASHPQNRHQTNRHDLSQHRSMNNQTSHWVFIEGYQRHGTWVSPRWIQRNGQHPNANQQGWHRIPGGWVGHARQRHWVNPHWENTRICRHRR